MCVDMEWITRSLDARGRLVHTKWNPSQKVKHQNRAYSAPYTTYNVIQHKLLQKWSFIMNIKARTCGELEWVSFAPQSSPAGDEKEKY